MAKNEKLSQSLIEKAEEVIKTDPNKPVVHLGMSTFMVKQGQEEEIKKVLGNNNYEVKGEVEGYDIIDSLDPLP